MPDALGTQAPPGTNNIQKTEEFDMAFFNIHLQNALGELTGVFIFAILKG